MAAGRVGCGRGGVGGWGVGGVEAGGGGAVRVWWLGEGEGEEVATWFILSRIEGKNIVPHPTLSVFAAPSQQSPNASTADRSFAVGTFAEVNPAHSLIERVT